MHYTDNSFYQTYESTANQVSSYLVDSSQQYYQAPYDTNNSSKIWYNNCCLKEAPYNTSGYYSNEPSYYPANSSGVDYKPVQVAMTTETPPRLAKRPMPIKYEEQEATAAVAGKKHRMNSSEMSSMVSVPSEARGYGLVNQSLSSQFSPSSSSSSATSQSSSVPNPNEEDLIFESLYKAYIAGTLSKSRYKRLIANERERKRMHGLNSAFESLRAVLPSLGSNKQFSKFETLQMAKSYIGALRELLSQDSSAAQSAPFQHQSQPASRTENSSADSLPFVKIIKIDSLDFI